MTTAATVDTTRLDTTRRYRAIFAYAILAVIAAYLLYYRAADTRAGGSQYQTGDWLINYADGFVRRGLFGEIFLAIAPGGTAGLWVLFVIQALLYGVVFAFAVWFLRRSDFSWSVIALVCGPAAIGFFGWDPEAGFRKEVLSYVSLAALVWGLVAARGKRWAVTLSVVSLIVFTLAVFSWETSALFLVAYLYLLLRGNEDAAVSVLFRRILAGAFVVVGALGLGLGTLFHGSVETADAICRDVRDHGFSGADLCSGAIDAIGWTSEYTLGTVRDSFPVYAGYLPLLALAILPIVLTPWFRRNWIWAVVITAAFLPLFVIVTDYGRWINMIVMALIFCIAAGPVQNAISRAWTWIGAILYTTLWGLPHWLAPDTESWPWRGLAKLITTAAIDLVERFLG